MPGGTWEGLTLSTGSATAGWNNVITYCPDTTPTASGVTFATLRDSIWSHWLTASNTIAVTENGNFTATAHGLANGIWSSWLNDSTTGATLNIGDGIWREWVDNPRHTPARTIPVQLTGNGAGPTNIVHAPPQKTKIQLLKEKIVRVRKVRKVKARGLNLLQSIVTPEQWRDFRRYGSVRETGEFAVYEVGCGWIGHVYELDFQGNPLRKLCLQMGVGQAGKQFTKGDRIAAVLLALRDDEAGTVSMAGKHKWKEHEKERVKARRGHLVVVAA